jgi:hypothetical protein
LIFAALMSDDFGIIPLGQHGGWRPGAGRPRKGQVRQEKTSASLKSEPDRSRYYLRRLVRDAQDGVRDAAILLQGIRDGRISEYAAGCEMNYCRRREPTGRGSENMTRRNDWAMHRLFNPRPVPKVPTSAEKAADVASSISGEEETEGLRPEPNAVGGTLK